MQHSLIVSGVLIDDAALSLEELARACQVEPDWVLRHVQAGVLGEGESVQLSSVRFRSSDLRRARKLATLEHVFDANEDIAALVIDMADEIARLRARLRVLGGE